MKTPSELRRASSVSDITVSTEVIDVAHRPISVWTRLLRAIVIAKFPHLTTFLLLFFSLIGNLQQGNRTHQTLPPILLLSEPLWVHALLASTLLADYGQTWRQPKNWKYITYGIVVREGPSRGQNNINKYRKFREVWTCGLWDMQAERQTDYTPTFIAILRTSSGGEVIMITEHCIYCSHSRFTSNNNKRSK